MIRIIHIEITDNYGDDEDWEYTVERIANVVRSQYMSEDVNLTVDGSE